MGKVSIAAPVLDKRGKIVGSNPVTGYVALLPLGEAKHRFLIQTDAEGDPEYLTDFASGGILAKLKPIALELYVANPYSTRPSPRRLAEIALARLVASVGVERITGVMAEQPVRNSVKGARK